MDLSKGSLVSLEGFVSRARIRSVGREEGMDGRTYGWMDGWRDAGGARTQVLLLREEFSMISAGNSGVFCDLGEQRPGFLMPQSWWEGWLGSAGTHCSFQPVILPVKPAASSPGTKLAFDLWPVVLEVCSTLLWALQEGLGYVVCSSMFSS